MERLIAELVRDSRVEVPAAERHRCTTLLE
jgi:hypothetical protein